MPYGDGETLSFTVKPLLSMDESIRFIEDVVRECIMADDMLIIPLARDFIVKRNLMTYYANFTMPESQSKTYDFVMAATGIIAVILDNIDLEQFNMIRQSIDERIAFEERKMIAEQQSNVRQITENVSEFVSKMSGLFDGVDAEQMGNFVTSMGKMAQNTEIFGKQKYKRIKMMEALMRKAFLEEDFMDVEDLMETTLPPPTLLEYYRRLNDREILWNDLIDDGMIDIPMYIFKWNKEDKGLPVEERKPIKIFINSDGGTANVTLYTANVIALSKTPVITIGMGRAYSSGGLLLMAGHKRYIFDSTSILIHDGSTGAVGDTGKVLDNLEFTKESEAKVRKFILEHTNIPQDLIDRNYRRDWFMFSDEAIKYGVADEIITDLDEII